MNRRDFLQARNLAHVAGPALEEPATDSASSLQTSLLRFARNAMGTSFELVLPFGCDNALEMAELALDEIDRLESQLTVYRESSEVSRLNRLASGAPVPVEESLFDLLTLAARLTSETWGAFDISAGALVKAWGFFKGPRRVPSDQELAAANARVGMRHVCLDATTRAVRYKIPGLEINLGSIGKGFALDRVVKLLRGHGFSAPLLLHGGHSSVHALGDSPGSRHGWEVGIRHPHEPQQRLAVVHLHNQALGTSAASFQYLEHMGRKLGHILDPRTGWPAHGIASASVVAESAAVADALATAFFILGIEQTRAYCEQHPEIGVLLLPETIGARPIVFGLSKRAVTLAA
jgi:thiamine biosynthesis lipoprotein